MIKLTYKEILEEIKKNGLPKIQNYFYEFEDGDKSDTLIIGRKVVGVCALGQAAVNLSKKYEVDLTAEKLESAIDFSFASYIEGDNDDSDMTFEQIAKSAEEKFVDYDWFSDIIRIDID